MKNTCILGLLGLFFITSISQAQKPIPDLILAKTLPEQFHASDYLVSEKLDGIRAYWDGKQLLSRQGNPFSAPADFINALPKDHALDGELWIGRHQFEQTQSIVSSSQANWEKIHYMLFELPDGQGSFVDRYRNLQIIVGEIDDPRIQVIPQYEFSSKKEVLRYFDQIISLGGEGIMLHRKTALYHSGRSNDLLKLKPYHDDEATVLSHIPGKGKFTGLMGSLKVINDAGITFKIGSGFTLEQRKKPPAIGSKVTYRFQNLTRHGKPRHPRFLRIYTPN